MLRKLLNFLTILYLIDGRDSPLYHSTDVLPKNAKLIKQLPLLEVPSDRSCDITACHLSTKDNKIHHLNCHIDNCDYGSYHCLHDGKNIVHFCGKFNQCDEHTRHIAQINDPLQGVIGIFEVPCPEGYIQPNINHSCFEPCIPDKSSGQTTTEYEPPDPHSDNTSIPHHNQQNETESPNQDITDVSKSAEEIQENGDETIFNIVKCIIVIACIILLTTVVLLLWKKKVVNKTYYKKKEIINNVVNLNNPSNVTINVDGKQSEPLLEDSSVNNNDNANDQNDNPIIDDRSEESLELIRGRTMGDGQFLSGSQTLDKQPLKQAV